MTTTFILGAGASIDCEFPVGKELYKNILTKGLPHSVENDVARWRAIHLKEGLNSHPLGIQIRSEYSKYGESDEDQEALEKFRALYLQMESSLHESIDYLIDEFPELAWWGKLAIAEQLMAREAKLFQNRIWKNKQDIWYYELFRSGLVSPTHLKDHKLQFITFNYDRSLEMYLDYFFMNTYKKSASEEEKAQFLRDIPIIHIHGSLGPREEMAQEFSKYENGNRIGTIKKAARYLKTIQEGKSDENFQTAKKWIESSDKVYVLGFGFNPENTNSLFDVEFPEYTVGTAYGHSPVEIKLFSARARNVFYPKFLRQYHDPSQHSREHKPRLYNCTIANLFKNHHPLIELSEGGFMGTSY